MTTDLHADLSTWQTPRSASLRTSPPDRLRTPGPTGLLCRASYRRSRGSRTGLVLPRSPRSDEEIVTAATTEGRSGDPRGGSRPRSAGTPTPSSIDASAPRGWSTLGVSGCLIRGSRWEPSGCCSGPAASVCGAATMIWIERIRATGYPDAEYMVEILLEPPDPERVADFFEQRAAGD